MSFKDEAWLKNQYIVQRKSVTKISEECNVSREVIISYLDKYGIYRPLPKDIHPKRW
jgi:CTP synthase (UTP-ammonia lyase)